MRVPTLVALRSLSILAASSSGQSSAPSGVFDRLDRTGEGVLTSEHLD